jgi:glycosyltransferase involved in cell wall biosynthesis
MWFLPQMVNLDGVDLFHAPSNILPRGIDMPCVTTIHDIMWLTDPQLCSARLWGKVERHFFAHGIKRALRKSDAIMTVSEATRATILDIHPQLAERTFASLPGVATPFAARAIEPEELRRIGCPTKRYFLTVGQNSPYKNHAGAIRAFASAFAGDEGVDLVIVQRRGSGAEALQRLANRLGLAGRVHVFAPLEEADLVTLYCGALGLLHPSFCEGFGMPLAEAMACGCPVITSNISAMPEVTAGAALLVDPHDTASIAAALKRVACEPGLASELRKKGLIRARALNWEKFAADTLTTYLDVLMVK